MADAPHSSLVGLPQSRKPRPPGVGARPTLKAIGAWLAAFAALMVPYGLGYWQGRAFERKNVSAWAAREMAPMCTAMVLVHLRQAERLIAAKNRRPIVVECRR